MVSLASLWLPILVSAVAVFVASSIIWMVLPYHKTDWRKLPNEPAFAEALRAQNLGGGMYMFPHCGQGGPKTPEDQERMKKGPWGSLTLLPVMPTMSRALGLWFVNSVIVAVVVAYVAGLVIAPGAEFKTVMRVTGTAAWLAYSGGALPGAIWEGKPASYACKSVVDGLVYGLATGAVFGWLWPDAAASG